MSPPLGPWAGCSASLPPAKSWHPTSPTICKIKGPQLYSAANHQFRHSYPSKRTITLKPISIHWYISTRLRNPSANHPTCLTRLCGIPDQEGTAKVLAHAESANVRKNHHLRVFKASLLGVNGGKRVWADCALICR